MAFLGFVGAPPAPITYPTFVQQATGTGFGASTLGAAKDTALAAIALRAALFLGAGAAGIWIGQKILEGLESPEFEPQIMQNYKVPSGVGRIRVFVKWKARNFDPVTTSVVVDSPVVAPFNISEGEQVSYGVLSGATGTFVAILTILPANLEEPFLVVNVQKESGEPVEGLRKVPGYVPNRPYLPFTNPTTLPVPSPNPPYPITPTVVPNPGNDPEKEDEYNRPGLIVKIPETGQQIVFAPEGVYIGRYRGTDTAPYEIPALEPEQTPPKVAVNPCPCPEKDIPDVKEILCRVKTLQDEILDDGYTYSDVSVGSDQGMFVEFGTDDVVAVELEVVEMAVNERRQTPAPGTPPIYFFGSCAWTYNSYPGERVPISYTNTNWIPPAGATGFVYSFHDAIVANCRYRKRVKKEYIDRC